MTKLGYRCAPVPQNMLRGLEAQQNMVLPMVWARNKSKIVYHWKTLRSQTGDSSIAVKAFTSILFKNQLDIIKYSGFFYVLMAMNILFLWCLLTNPSPLYQSNHIFTIAVLVLVLLIVLVLLASHFLNYLFFFLPKVCWYRNID